MRQQDVYDLIAWQEGRVWDAVSLKLLSNDKVSKRSVIKWLDVPGTTNTRSKIFEDRVLDITDWLEEHHPAQVCRNRGDIDYDGDDEMSVCSGDTTIIV